MPFPVSAACQRLLLAGLVAFAAIAPRMGAQATSRQRDTIATRRSAPSSKQAGKKNSRKTSATRAKPKRAAVPAKPLRPVPVWPVKGPAPRPDALLPHKRIVAFYGNPLSKRMGILGELPSDQMLRRLDEVVATWAKADSSTPVVPALHLIATVAQGAPGADGKWRTRMGDSLIERVYRWAQQKHAILFLDVQVGQSTLEAELPRFEKYLARPDIHLAVDPEFSMKGGNAPGTKIGTLDAADVNYASDFLARIVDRYKLPSKILVVHRFTRPMLTNYRDIRLDPRVQIVIDMDGWGAPWLKRQSYSSYVYEEPVQYTGFKLFFHNDTKKGHALMRPADVLALHPKPVYIQYQ
jgi:hypothetical protein